MTRPARTGSQSLSFIRLIVCRYKPDACWQHSHIPLLGKVSNHQPPVTRPTDRNRAISSIKGDSKWLHIRRIPRPNLHHYISAQSGASYGWDHRPRRGTLATAVQFTKSRVRQPANHYIHSEQVAGRPAGISLPGAVELLAILSDQVFPIRNASVIVVPAGHRSVTCVFVGCV